jgi:hypothetical protein
MATARIPGRGSEGKDRSLPEDTHPVKEGLLYWPAPFDAAVVNPYPTMPGGTITDTPMPGLVTRLSFYLTFVE